MNQNLIITISRQYGSGGRETGVLLSQQMGIPLYDRELQTVAAARSGIDLKLLENVDETASNSLLYNLVMKSGSNITDTIAPINTAASATNATPRCTSAG